MKRMQLFKYAATGLAVSIPVVVPNVALQASPVESKATAKSERAIQSLVAKTNKALAKGQVAKALASAEQLVALDPNSASHRFLLGQVYLAAGRFYAAETSFDDAMKLSPGHERAALNLALTKIARGNTDAALALLEEHHEGLSAADYGLALALSGEIDRAVRVLEDAARSPGADARTRQNLALTYAMSNRWIEARIVAAQDLSLDLLDQRMTEWAMFVRPQASWDQVAGLLRVKPVYDPGQPAALALGDPFPAQQQAQAAAEPEAAPARTVTVALDEPAPAVAPAAQPARFEVASVAASAPVPAPAPAVSQPDSRFQIETVEEAAQAEAAAPAPMPAVSTAPARVAAPAPVIRPEPAPLKQAVVPASSASAGGFKKAAVAAASEPLDFKPVESGKFAVQLGAFNSLGVADKAWSRLAGRHQVLGGLEPQTARVKVNGNQFYRLSVTGFLTRAQAGQVCTRVKATGGDCFVRALAGDSSLRMALRKASKKVQLASR